MTQIQEQDNEDDDESFEYSKEEKAMKKTAEIGGVTGLSDKSRSRLV
jgi:hypothetical protein